MCPPSPREEGGHTLELPILRHSMVWFLQVHLLERKFALIEQKEFRMLSIRQKITAAPGEGMVPLLRTALALMVT